MICSHGLTTQMLVCFKPCVLPVIPDHPDHIMLITSRFIGYSGFPETMAMICSHGLTMQMTVCFKPCVLPVISDHLDHIMLRTLCFISYSSYSSCSETMAMICSHGLTMQMRVCFKPCVLLVIPDHLDHIMLRAVLSVILAIPVFLRPWEQIIAIVSQKLE